MSEQVPKKNKGDESWALTWFTGRQPHDVESIRHVLSWTKNLWRWRKRRSFGECNAKIDYHQQPFLSQGACPWSSYAFCFGKKMCTSFSSQTKTGLSMSADPVEEALERFLDVQPWPCRLRKTRRIKCKVPTYTYIYIYIQTKNINSCIYVHISSMQIQYKLEIDR